MAPLSKLRRNLSAPVVVILSVTIIMILSLSNPLVATILKWLFITIDGAVFASIILFFFIKSLAKEAILFTTVKEGTAKIILRGNSFERILMSFEGFHLNDPMGPGFKPDKANWEVLFHGPGNTNGFTGEMMEDSYYDRRSWLLKYLGIYWIGWPWSVKVHVYQFVWNETRTDENGAESVFPRAEATDLVYVSDFVYVFVTQDAETSENLQVTVLTFATVAVRNPYRALFSGEDWMVRVTAAINRNSRAFIGSQKYNDIIRSTKRAAAGGSTDTVDLTEYSAPIIALSSRLPDDVDTKPPFGLLGRYGVEIRTVDLQKIDLSGDAKDRNQEAATKAYVAEQEAIATRTTGKAKADVIEMTGEAEAKSLERRLSVISAVGEVGIRLAQYDAMQESSRGPGNTIVWGAPQPLVPTLPVAPNKPAASQSDGGSV
ncbi:MAG TPA: SPFH domain-containing protein [Candidatus Paceibacterota bacterium]|nr:SPFH domain-containing protein [Candidatus Paceibacterota bacterium]